MSVLGLVLSKKIDRIKTTYLAGQNIPQDTNFSPHKLNSFKRESISKLPGGMALYVSC